MLKSPTLKPKKNHMLKSPTLKPKKESHVEEPNAERPNFREIVTDLYLLIKGSINVGIVSGRVGSGIRVKTRIIQNDTKLKRKN